MEANRPVPAPHLAILAVNGLATIECPCRGTPGTEDHVQTGQESGECQLVVAFRAHLELSSVNELSAPPDITGNHDDPMTKSDWAVFENRVAEVANVSRAAAGNVVTALTSFALAIAAATIAISTADRRTGVWQNPARVAIAGAMLASLVLIGSLGRSRKGHSSSDTITRLIYNRISQA